MRSLLFTIWILSDKSVTGTLAMLEQLTKGQLETVEQGGARMINASLAGKSFSYELPANWGAFEFTNLLMQCYKIVTTKGSSGVMSETELQTFVLDANNEVTDTMLARINYNNIR